MGNMNKKKRGC